jgi:malonyl-CoA O-methyltransferase
VAPIAGDAERWPLRAQVADLVLANLVLPSCRPDRVFGEAARVLAAGGAFVFATLGPDSLTEVRQAFAAVDDALHVHAAFDLHDLGDLALAAGLSEPVLDVDRLEVTYPDLATLVRDLRATGAINTAPARRKGLTGRRRWQAFERALLPARGGRLAVTLELILGIAWGRGEVGRRAPSGEVAIPVGRIGRRGENR